MSTLPRESFGSHSLSKLKEPDLNIRRNGSSSTTLLPYVSIRRNCYSKLFIKIDIDAKNKGTYLKGRLSS